MRINLKRAVCFALTAVILLLAGAVISSSAVRLIYPRKYSAIVTKWCTQYGVDESLVYAVIFTESGFDPDAVSAVGAMGLMQITPDTFEWLQTKTDGDPYPTQSLYEPDINIRYGVLFLSLLCEEFGSDRLAVAAYHAGRGKVNYWLRESLCSDSDTTRIPSSATGHYVHKVETARQRYIDIYYS